MKLGLTVTWRYWTPLQKIIMTPVKSSRARRVESQRSIQAKIMREKSTLVAANTAQAIRA